MIDYLFTNMPSSMHDILLNAKDILVSAVYNVTSVIGAIFTWGMICFIEIILIPLIIAIILLCYCNYNKEYWPDNSMKEKVINTIILIIFPPVAGYHYHTISKAFITLLVMFAAFVVTIALLVILSKLFPVTNFGNEWIWMVLLIIFTWISGIIYLKYFPRKNIE